MSKASFGWLVWNANRHGQALNPIQGAVYSSKASWDVNELLRIYPEQFAKLRPKNAWAKVLEADTDEEP